MEVVDIIDELEDVYRASGGARREHNAVQPEALSSPRLCMALRGTLWDLGCCVVNLLGPWDCFWGWHDRSRRYHCYTDTRLSYVSLVCSCLCLSYVQSGKLIYFFMNDKKSLRYSVLKKSCDCVGNSTPRSEHCKGGPYTDERFGWIYQSLSGESE